jgi:thioredoxin reductase
MRKNDKSAPSHHEYLIIGGGPAGLQLGYFLEMAGRDYLILEAGETPGSFFKKFPRHRKLISINKVHTGQTDPELNLRWDWNSLLCDSEDLLLKNYSKSYFPEADTFVAYLKDFAAHYRLKIEYGVRVSRITRKEDGFRVGDSEGQVYSCQRLIIATGFSREYVAPIPGIELAESYANVDVRPEEFTNQKVLIIGKGNSAFETADNLVETAAVIHVASPQRLNLAWQTHFVGHLRAVNNNFLDTYQLKSQNAVIDATIEKIERQDGRFLVDIAYSHAKGQRSRIAYDRVIACTGFRFDDSIFDETCRPKLVINDRFPEQTSEWESTNVKDLYFAGTLMQMRDFKKTTSGFIHGFRYNVRALHRMLELKYHGREWPSRPINATPEDVLEAIINRVNTNSAIWQQFGFICDLVVVPEHGPEALYYEEVPADFIRHAEFGKHPHYYTVTLEYGHAEGDPFGIERDPDPRNARTTAYLHPIIRRFNGARLINEHHVLDDLENNWFKDESARPLAEFIQGEFARSSG